MIRYGNPSHAWPCPVSVGHSTCTCEPPQPGRHRARRPAPWEAALVLVALAAFVAVVGVLA